MKRLLLILLLAGVTISLFGRDGKPYSITRAYTTPGASEAELTKRAELYFREASSDYQTVYDYRANPSARAREFLFLNQEIESGGKKYRCDITLDISITPTGENNYTVCLDRVGVHAYRGHKLVLEDRFGLGEDDTHDYDGFLRRETMYRLSQDVKAFAASVFDDITQEIAAAMERPPLQMDFMEAR